MSNLSDDPPAPRFKVRVATDMRPDLGAPLVSRGFEISQSFVDRVRNFGPGYLEERVTNTPRSCGGHDHLAQIAAFTSCQQLPACAGRPMGELLPTNNTRHH